VSGLRLYAIPFSTNVERVALALGHKGVDAEVVMCDPADRTPIREASGQDLVPVLDDEGFVVADSSRIVEHLEERFPDPPLFPAGPTRTAETRIFVDWFNRVWKVPPNRIEEELRAEAPDHVLIEALAAEMHASLALFEELLQGRGHLLGDDFSAADCAAFPFLKYGLWIRDDDDERFHRILAEHLALDGGYPRLEDWLRRVDERPRVAGVIVHPAHA
jgi:maleylacetoacetate isomerase